MKNKKLFAILTLICFALTLMPVAAFAAPNAVDPASSAVVLADDADDTIAIASKDGKTTITFVTKTAAGENKTPDQLFVWATEGNSNPSPVLDLGTAGTEELTNVYSVNPAATAIEVKFVRAGEFTIHAGIANSDVTVASMKDIVELTGEAGPTITVFDPSTTAPVYTLEMTIDGETQVITETANGEISGVRTDNVAETYTLKLKKDGKIATGKNISIEAGAAAIVVTPKAKTTNYNGEVKFDLSASRDGEYPIYVKVDNKDFKIVVSCGNTAAAYIETSKEPASLIAQYDGLLDTANRSEVQFTITDINGNGVTAPEGQFAEGMDKIADPATVKKHLFFTEKPKTSTLNDANLVLTSKGNGVWDLTTTAVFDAEGTYAVKVILDNGAVATASWTVKAFQTPVMLIIGTAADTVELGGAMGVSLKYRDANGVMKAATDAKLAAAGYAVKAQQGNAQVTVKSDEKYVGSTITLTAVSERYNLVANKNLTVADVAVAIAFEKVNAAVNVNNKINWNIADASGNKVVLGSNTTGTSINYIVLDKPEGAKVYVADKTNPNDLKNKGIGAMTLVSDKVGNVTVQAIVTAQYNNTDTQTVQTTYYTGTVVIPVGTEGTGNVVVMSIGSNEIVANDKKSVIDAAPMVQNNRTFVPFRALAEAFGATVAYDEATQSVTAELNGTTVVMTIGSATYTVNGVEKAADVAPFISASRTYVPVRFAAEAFGIKVTPTYDEKGATADVLFVL